MKLSKRNMSLVGLLILINSIASAATDKTIEEAVKAAKKLEVEDVAGPVRTVTRSITALVPNADNKTWDILQVYFEKYGAFNNA